MRSVQEFKRRARAALWANVGSVLTGLTFFKMPEWVREELVKAQRAVYFKWADTRVLTPRCIVCTQPLLDAEKAITFFCSDECAGRFAHDQRRQGRVPVGSEHVKEPS